MRTYAVDKNSKQEKQQARLKFAQAGANVLWIYVRFVCHLIVLTLSFSQ
jgi:hypothetical protein